jgi:hypothetical protein
VRTTLTHVLALLIQDIEHGSVRNLPYNFPFPPSSPPYNGVTDRFQTSCIKDKPKTCAAAIHTGKESCGRREHFRIKVSGDTP